MIKMAKPETHVSDEKKRIVKELAELMKKKTVMVVSIKGLPSSQFQQIKKQLRDKALIRVTKKSLVDFALEHAKDDSLNDLVKYVEDGSAMLFSEEDAFEISGILADSKTPAKAKAGQIASEDIEIPEGPTDLPPGPDISALSAVGLQVQVQDGKIAIMKPHIMVKKGDQITEDQASILAKLDITPFESGLEPVAASMDGTVYADIKIDKEAMLEALLYAYGRAIPFAVEVGQVNELTLDLILAKASAHEGVIRRIVTGEPEPEPVVVEEKKEEVKEEVKEEPQEESTAGLASLF